MLYPYQDNTELCGREAKWLIVRGGSFDGKIPPNLTFACDDCKAHYVKSIKQIAQTLKSDTSNIELYPIGDLVSI